MTRAVVAAPSRGLTLEALLVAVFVRAGLRLVPLPRLVRLLARLPPAAYPAALDACLQAAGRAVERAAHPTCLFTSLVAFALLARRGYDVRFQLGVASGPPFEAHAWLTLPAGGVDEQQHGRFQPIWDYRVVRRAA